jgi:chromosome segregation ATPase
MSHDAGIFPDGTYDVVGPDKLKDRTAAGYRLVRVIQAVSMTQFLVVQHRDATHEDLRGTIAKLEAERLADSRKAWDLKNEIARLRLAVEKAVAELGELADDNRQLEEVRSEIEQHLGSYRERFAIMEDDLARVRKFVGEKTWAEALAQEPAE